MIKRYYSLLVPLTCLLLPAGDALAQDDLSLFEPVETVVAPPRPDSRERQDRGSNGEPEFTLVGTSRIGSKVRATLLTRSGETVVVQGESDGSALIPGHAGYQVSDIESRHVSISYPEGASCIPAEDRGVNCSGNTASLSLTTAAPVVEEAQDQAGGQSEEAANSGAAEGVPSDNPFAAALRAAAAEAPEDIARRRAEAQRFQPRRIRPEDVPEGKRLVRTPFGDRLIDE